jgi:hypothetical protein
MDDLYNCHMSPVFWDITPCSPLEVTRHVGSIFSVEAGRAKLVEFPLSLGFGPECGGEIFFQNKKSVDCQKTT